MLTYGQFIAVVIWGIANFFIGVYVTVNAKCVKIVSEENKGDK